MITVRVHQTRHVADDVVPLREPGRQTLARAGVEMASDADNDNRTRALIAAVVPQRLVRPDLPRAFVTLRPTLPKRALIRETILDVEAGSHSCPCQRAEKMLARYAAAESWAGLRLDRPA